MGAGGCFMSGTMSARRGRGACLSRAKFSRRSTGVGRTGQGCDAGFAAIKLRWRGEAGRGRVGRAAGHVQGGGKTPNVGSAIGGGHVGTPPGVASRSPLSGPGARGGGRLRTDGGSPATLVSRCALGSRCVGVAGR